MTSLNKIYSTDKQRQQFIQERGITYLQRPKYRSELGFERALKDSPYYKENREEFETLYKNYGKLIEEAYMAQVSIKNISEKVGYGLFADKNFEAGELIGEYTGLVKEGVDIPFEEETEEYFSTDYTWDYPDGWYEDRLFEINALEMGNELRYVNHSFSPNLVVEHCLVGNHWSIFFIAGQAIKKGTQFTVDYGEEYWSGGFRELVLL